VYCRVRPLSHDELARNDDNVVSFPEENIMLVNNPQTNQKKSFEFEKIYNPELQQGILPKIKIKIKFQNFYPEMISKYSFVRTLNVFFLSFSKFTISLIFYKVDFNFGTIAKKNNN
jgi:hypothetical protein